VTITASPFLGGVFRRLAGGLLLQQAAGVFLRLAALGQVPGDLGEAPQRAGPVSQGGDDDVGPEHRTVLAHAPALVLEAAVGGSAPQLLVRPAPVHGLLRIKAREMLADDLASPVALDARGAGVPGSNVTLRVQEEDGVILDALDQQTKALLVPLQFIAGLWRIGTRRVCRQHPEKLLQESQHGLLAAS
jgi:hypothetical protein